MDDKKTVDTDCKHYQTALQAILTYALCFSGQVDMNKIADMAKNGLEGADKH